jgi:site-specific DNA-methyltransferase (adenine-specific)
MKAGLIVFTKSGMPRFKRYLSATDGKPISNVWTDIFPINSQAQERLGYPTQKPELLLERIVGASCPEGGTVLDPFCGCGTTISAAQKLERKWIGIDITHLAMTLIKSRLLDTFGTRIGKAYKTVGEPVDLASAWKLAEDDKYQFQYWALGLVGARPLEEKKGADKGIDGRLYFSDSANAIDVSDVKEALISVKGGHVTVNQIRDLRGVIERDGAAIGVFICIEPPTKPMLKEAADAGVYTSPIGTSHPRIQILTVEDLLSEKKIDMPPTHLLRTFKTAPRSRKKQGQPDLF